MLAIVPQMRLLVAVEPVDFRRGIDGLAAVCRQRLQVEPMSGALFIFGSRNRKSIKILAYDGQGFLLFQKRLSQGKFGWWPTPQGQAVHPLEARQLQLLLWNGNPSGEVGAPLWRPLSPGG
jgi:transposase